MRILLIEDKQVNIDGAKIAFADHELTVVTTADEGMIILEERVDRDKYSLLTKKYLAEIGLPETTSRWQSGLSEDVRSKVTDIYNRSYREALISFDFDVVLTDMLMPSSMKQLGSVSQQFTGVEMPYGLNFIFRAANRGAKYIGMLSDMSHHDHPMAAALDEFPTDKVFQLNNAKVVVCVEKSKHYPLSGACERCGGTGKELNNRYNQNCYDCYGGGIKGFHAKDWQYVLDLLIKAQ